MKRICSVILVLFTLFLYACKSNSLIDTLNDGTEALVSPLMISKMTDVSMPDAKIATSYDADFQNMKKHYVACAENYAKMVITLAKADNQQDLAEKVSKVTANLQLDTENQFVNAEALIEMSKNAKPMKRLDFQKYSKEKMEAYVYGENALKEFQQAVKFAREIGLKHFKDFEVQYDKKTKKNVNVGPAFKYAKNIQDNMNKIDGVANVILAKNGKQVLSDLTEEVNSWFAEPAK